MGVGGWMDQGFHEIMPRFRGIEESTSVNTGALKFGFRGPRSMILEHIIANGQGSLSTAIRYFRNRSRRSGDVNASMPHLTSCVKATRLL
jgi:hypothetical protein